MCTKARQLTIAALSETVWSQRWQVVFFDTLLQLSYAALVVCTKARLHIVWNGKVVCASFVRVFTATDTRLSNVMGHIPCWRPDERFHTGNVRRLEMYNKCHYSNYRHSITTAIRKWLIYELGALVHLTHGHNSQYHYNWRVLCVNNRLVVSTLSNSCTALY